MMVNPLNHDIKPIHHPTGLRAAWKSFTLVRFPCPSFLWGPTGMPSINEPMLFEVLGTILALCWLLITPETRDEWQRLLGGTSHLG
jgi:hypothetical protein